MFDFCNECGEWIGATSGEIKIKDGEAVIICDECLKVEPECGDESD